MIARVVLVDFKPDAPAEAFEAYEKAKARLARLPCVSRMISGCSSLPKAEANLNQRMPRVTFPQVASIWEFEDDAALDAFLSAPEHFRMLDQGFLPHVAHRYVANIRSK